MPCFTRIRTLELCDSFCLFDTNVDPSPDVQALAASPMTVGLRELALVWFKVGPEECSALATSPYLAKLTSLRLTECSGLTAEGQENLRAAFGEAVSFHRW